MMDLIAKIKSLTKEQKLASILLIITLIPLIGGPIGIFFYILPSYAFGAMLFGVMGQLEKGAELNSVLWSAIVLIISIPSIFYLLKRNNFRHVFGFMLWLIYFELCVLGYFIFAYVFAG
jgi:hypothetical protein